MMRAPEEEDPQPRLMYELCALALSILRSPPLPTPCSAPLPPAPPRPSPSGTRRLRASPAGLASLLLGMSLALMLCGSVTFVIGFVLMPWVIGLVVVFYLVGLVSSISVLGRAIFCPGPASARSPRKEMAGSVFQTSSYLDAVSDIHYASKSSQRSLKCQPFTGSY